MTATTPKPAPPPAPDLRTAKVVVFYQTLTAQALAGLSAIYTDDARFIDPFNDVIGRAGILKVFQHMFETLDDPRFEVERTVTEGDDCFVVWNFHFRRKGQPHTMLVHGATQLRFAPDGRIAWHRDHWDPARELYEGIPVLGSVLRWLRQRLSAPT